MASVVAAGPTLGLSLAASPSGVVVATHGAGVVGTAAANIVRAVSGGDDDKTYNRVTPRKGTKAEVRENQPKNEKGEMLDPHTGKVLDENDMDLGHKPGNEWRTRKQMHQSKGSTRKEVLDAENDPDLYHYEDRSTNRSHKYEKKN